ncbi:MAG: 3-octaprenyl-4-hydroxybenzoate carboxy-lyase, partial [Burkholderiaceae bacterium]|nr:3-octaprenyl-4-hydroxybenzoate carboxy-lyase [Burkholderiaceae bacterium]
MDLPGAPQRIIVGISGASGAVYGVRLLQVLRDCPGVQSHLVVSDTGWRTLRHELGLERPAVQALAHQAHDARDVGASIASGSFQCTGM